MKRLSLVICVIALGLPLAIGVGCRPKTAFDPAVTESAGKLPGADEVMAALDKKDYEGVITALNKVREGVANEEQNVAFMVLARQARDKMSEAAATDEKAAQAVAILRALSTGGR